MVKKNSNFKFKGAMKKDEKKPRKNKSTFVHYEDSALFKNDENPDDLVRTFLRDTRGFRSTNYYDDDTNSSLW